jgi:hypothetical protein
MKYIAGLLLLFTLISCYEQERKCTEFKTGKFSFSQEIDGKKLSSTFTRTEFYQIETFNGKTDTASIRWVNDCEFILEKLHPKNMQEKKAITMKILYTKGDSYIFEYAFVGDQNKMRGEAVKLN